MTISATPRGSGRGVPISKRVEMGKPVTIKAVANKGWKFDHWEGDVPPAYTSRKQFVINVEEDIELVAAFTPSGVKDKTYIHELYPTALKTKKHMEVARMKGRTDKKSDMIGFTA